MNNPRVSVIIPTFKRPDTLIRAVESVRKQTFRNIEILVVDDNIPEEEHRYKTEQVMMRYKDIPNIKYIKHPKNLNGSAARNTGIKNASGDYIAFLDDDDEFLPDKIEKQVTKMESLDDSWGACYTNYVKKDAEGNVIQTGAEKREGKLKKEVLMRNLYISAGSNLLIRREVIEKIKGFDEKFRRNQDLEFLVRIAEYYKIAYEDSCSLVINLDKKIARLTIEDIQNINDLFMQTFKLHIDTLSSREKNDLYLMNDLDMFKHIIQRKLVFIALKYVVKKKIKLSILIKYIYYLIYRKITKKCFGFAIR
ncbi:glycosyltransferase family 2 protein [Priestia megaterium]|uniref:glycosyltransferase family 2 protein n=1 Tax=Priestia megaterium TaxID=1404 RepID=UPI0031FDE4DA